MKLYVNMEEGKAYTQVTRDKYIRAMVEADGAFENWLDENFLASEIVGESKEILYKEFMESLKTNFEDIEVELV